MIVRHSDIMFGVPCYVKEAHRDNIKANAIPLSTIIAALDEGMAIEEVGEQYGLTNHEVLSIVSYVQKNGTS